MIRRQFMNVRREICCERGIPKGMIILSFILTEYLMRIWIFIAMLGSTIKKIHWREHNWAINDFFDFFLIRLGFEGNLILNWCGLLVFFGCLKLEIANNDWSSWFSGANNIMKTSFLNKIVKFNENLFNPSAVAISNEKTFLSLCYIKGHSKIT